MDRKLASLNPFFQVFFLNRLILTGITLQKRFVSQSLFSGLLFKCFVPRKTVLLCCVSLNPFFQVFFLNRVRFGREFR